MEKPHNLKGEKDTSGSKDSNRKLWFVRIHDENIYKTKTCKSDNLYQQENGPIELEMVIKGIIIIFKSLKDYTQQHRALRPRIILYQEFINTVPQPKETNKHVNYLHKAEGITISSSRESSSNIWCKYQSHT